MADEMSNGKIEEFLSPEPSFLEETSVLKEKGSSKASWLDNGRGCRHDDALPLKFVKLRLFDFNALFPSGRSTKYSSSSDQTEDETILDCHTPTKRIFDLSSPAPDDSFLAPKKKLRDSYVPICRRLNYDGCASEVNFELDAVKEPEEEQILGSVYTSLLDLIISMQLAEVSAKETVDPNIVQVCMTPISLPMQKKKGACPPAPMKPKSAFKRCGQSVRRKLNFGISLN